MMLIQSNDFEIGIPLSETTIWGGLNFVENIGLQVESGLNDRFNTGCLHVVLIEFVLPLFKFNYLFFI